MTRRRLAFGLCYFGAMAVCGFVLDARQRPRLHRYNTRHRSMIA